MKSNTVWFITILGLSMILLIQTVWLYTSFYFVKDELTVRSTKMLEQALMEETFSRMHKLSPGTRIEGRTESDKNRNIPEFVYMQESLEKVGMPISLDSLNDIYRKLLQSNEYPDECMISIFKENAVIQSLGDTLFSFFTLQTNKVPLRKDYSIVVQARFINPNELFFRKMGTLLISTGILTILVVYCIVYQIRIISRMKKIFQVREDFSYALIHDMKTPLTTISMALDLLSKGRLDANPEMKASYCKIAEAETDRLLKLTNKVLTLSKLENHKLEITKSVVELRPMLKKLTDKFAASASKPVHFNIDLKVEEVYADEGYLEEVISNLIDNSIKYSGDSVDIEINSEKNEQYTIVKVYDNGLGIPEKHLRAIFEKYERGAASGRNRKGGAAGFGLGLNFAYRVVEAHEGKLLVSSIEGDFTEFSIYLPEILEEI
ncbi:MAG: HAMP domain-containing histidine kinase [Bacteroides heparinolyticus]|nr:HAMP domain-containing histidine kinase [Bacteroides heparinolyticus]